MMPGRPPCARQAKRLQPDGSPSVTSTDAVTNPWWGAFTASMTAQGLAVAPEIFPAATDASYLRVKGIPSLGFSPMRCAHALTRRPLRCCVRHVPDARNTQRGLHARARRRTPKLLHEHDEFLSVASFIEGIDIYEKLIPDLADFGAAHGRDAPSRDEL